MPEGSGSFRTKRLLTFLKDTPEVRLVTDQLRRKLVNNKIHNFEILGGRYQHHDPPNNFKKFINLLPLQVKSVNSYGKFIWFEFNNIELTMWNTLGMSGWW